MKVVFISSSHKILAIICLSRSIEIADRQDEEWGHLVQALSCY